MKRKVIAILTALAMSVVVVSGVAYFSNDRADATPVAAQQTICVVPTVCVTVPTVTLSGVTVTLPRRTITVLNPVTVRVPPVTVTRLLPGGIETIIINRTVTVRPSGTTTTVIVNREIVRNGTSAPITREVRTTQSQRVSTGQTTVTHGTIVPKKEVVRIPGGTVTKIQAVGIGLLALLALMALGLFLLWLGFVLGYRSSEKNNTSFLRALRDTVKRPGKHE